MHFLYNKHNMTLNPQIKLWLQLCAFMVIMMIFIGGLTRLSDAGLSIVEWKPVTGIIPPMTPEAWQIEFAKYQTSPEFQIINHQIELSEFKQIFWLEFWHRIAARLTGLAICLPMLYFYATKKLSFKKDKSYLWIIILLFAQGVMGWLMVKSGLQIVPHVSHFRLATHLILAVLLYHLILTKISQTSQKHWIISILIPLLYIQIFLGGLVAGLDAGMIYNTFPLMGGNFIPHELWSHENMTTILYDPSIVQFLHRSLAYIITILCIILAIKVHKQSKIMALFIITSIATQVTLGILTLIYVVPLSIALLHQICAIFLLSVIHFSASNKFLKNHLPSK
jgi:heme a synthase